MSIVTMLVLAVSGVQYVGEYPDIDSCVTAARRAGTLRG